MLNMLLLMVKIVLWAFAIFLIVYSLVYVVELFDELISVVRDRFWGLSDEDVKQLVELRRDPRDDPEEMERVFAELDKRVEEERRLNEEWDQERKRRSAVRDFIASKYPDGPCEELPVWEDRGTYLACHYDRTTLYWDKKHKLWQC